MSSGTPTTPLSLFTDPLKWQCDRCFLGNDPESRTCAKCKNPREDLSRKSPLRSSAPLDMDRPTTCGSQDPLNEPQLCRNVAPTVAEPPVTWRCATCFVTNEAKDTQCICCETPKEPPKIQNSGVSFSSDFFSESAHTTQNSPEFLFGGGLFRGKGANDSASTTTATPMSTEGGLSGNPLVFGLPSSTSKHEKEASQLHSWTASVTTFKSAEINFSFDSNTTLPTSSGFNMFAAQVARQHSTTSSCQEPEHITGAASPSPLERRTPSSDGTPSVVVPSTLSAGPRNSTLQKRSREYLDVLSGTPEIMKRQRMSSDDVPLPEPILPSTSSKKKSRSSSPHRQSSPCIVASSPTADATGVSMTLPPHDASSSEDGLLIRTPLRTDEGSFSGYSSSEGKSAPTSEQLPSSMVTQPSGFTEEQPQDETLTVKAPVSEEQEGHRYSFGVGDVRTSEGSLSNVEGLTPNAGHTPFLATPTFGSSSTSQQLDHEQQSINHNGATRNSVVDTSSVTATHVPDAAKARDAVGLAYTWGSGECDQLAVAEKFLNDVGAMPVPHLITKLRKQQIVQISCGALHSVVLLSDGTVATWGCNDDGALGREAEALERVPGRVQGLPQNDPIVSVSCGDSHTAALSLSGSCYLWGSYRDSAGSIGFPDYDRGHGSVEKRRTTKPSRVPELDGRCIRLVSGENHTAALCITEQNKPVAYLWGNGEFGQLACKPLPDMSEDKPTLLFPQRFSQRLAGSLTNVFCGRATTFFECRSGPNLIRYYGVGRNSSGELGIGCVSDVVSTCTELVALRNVELVDLTSCQFASIALDTAGNVYTWGKRGYLGDDASRDTPARLTGLDSIRQVGTGSDTMFAINKKGNLAVWGEGQMFQVGDGHDYVEPVIHPVWLPPESFGGGSVLQACGGSQHSLALVFAGDYLKNDAPMKRYQWRAPAQGTLGRLAWDFTSQSIRSRREAAEEHPEATEPKRRRRPLSPASELANAQHDTVTVETTLEESQNTTTTSPRLKPHAHSSKESASGVAPRVLPSRRSRSPVARRNRTNTQQENEEVTRHGENEVTGHGEDEVARRGEDNVAGHGEDDANMETPKAELSSIEEKASAVIELEAENVVVPTKSHATRRQTSNRGRQPSVEVTVAGAGAKRRGRRAAQPLESEPPEKSKQTRMLSRNSKPQASAVEPSVKSSTTRAASRSQEPRPSRQGRKGRERSTSKPQETATTKRGDTSKVRSRDAQGNSTSRKRTPSKSRGGASRGRGVSQEKDLSPQPPPPPRQRARSKSRDDTSPQPERVAAAPHTRGASRRGGISKSRDVPVSKSSKTIAGPVSARPREASHSRRGRSGSSEDVINQRVAGSTRAQTSATAKQRSAAPPKPEPPSLRASSRQTRKTTKSVTASRRGASSASSVERDAPRQRRTKTGQVTKETPKQEQQKSPAR